jgi:hypothetical protein
MLRAVWGAHHPSQLEPVGEVAGWRLDAGAKSEIDRILRESVSDPVGPECHGAGIAQGAWHNWQRSTAKIGGIRAQLP